MKRLLTTTAIALATSGMAFAAQAQDSGSMDSNADVTCETPWMQIDADNNGTVSDKEIKNHLDVSFSMLDKDGNGNVTRQEYADCYTQSAGTSDMKRDTKSFQAADVNSDEKVTHDEFRDQSQAAYENSRDNPDNSGYADEFKQYSWMSSDESKDKDFVNSLSADEAAARSAYTFQTLDANGDNSITEDEWVADSANAGRSEQRAEDRFAELDADSSDTLTREEFDKMQPTKMDKSTTASTSTSDSASGSSNEMNAENDVSADAGDGNSNDASGVVVEYPIYYYVFETF